MLYEYTYPLQSETHVALRGQDMCVCVWNLNILYMAGLISCTLKWKWLLIVPVYLLVLHLPDDVSVSAETCRRMYNLK